MSPVNQPVAEGGKATPTRLHRWGHLMARRRGRVVAIWLIALLVLGGALSSNFSDNLTAVDGQIPGSESERTDELITERFGVAITENDLLVFESDELAVDNVKYRAAVDAAIAEIAQLPLVEGVISPYDRVDQISPDGHAAFAIVAVGGSATERQDASPSMARVAEGAARSSSDGTVRVFFTGESPLNADLDAQATDDLKRAELIGLPVAAVVLVLAFGALVAAGLPLLLALSGIGVTFGVLGILSYFTDFVLITENITSLIGLGIGIDFAMFLVTRFREGLASGRTPANAVAEAMATSGRSIMVSGGSTLVALSGLLLVSGNIFTDLAVGAMTAVAIMVLAALTLLPAVLGWLGPRVNMGRVRRSGRSTPVSVDTETGVWARWTRLVMRRPAAFAVAGLTALVLASLPALQMDLGLATGASAVADRSSGAGLEVLAEHFSEGAIAPVEIVVTSENGAPLDRSQIDGLVAAVDERPDVAGTFVREVNEDGTAANIAAIPAHAIDDDRTEDLVVALREAPEPTGVDVAVGGFTAGGVDLADQVSARLPWVLAYVLGTTFVLLTALFRSPLLSLKAIVMNLLSVLAAYGMLVAAFQFGWAEAVFDFESPGNVQAFLPLLAFAVLFGISMDYEVFLLARMREEWLATGNNTEAVARGMQATARPITSAAAIQIAVFGAFAFTSVIDVKEVGFALAAAIFVDAVVVRVLLVPALMRLMGDWNWWSPRWMQTRDNAPEQGVSVATS